MYLIVNLVDRVLEVYKEPIQGEGRFNDISNPFQGQSIALPTSFGEHVMVAVKQLSP